MNFQTYKIFEIVNGFYYFIVSHINDLDLNLTIAENWGATDESNPINQFISLTCGWDPLHIEKSDICTIENSDYHSFRRDKEFSGRMAAFIGMI